MWLLLRAFHTVEISIELQYSAACPGRQFDTNILEGSVDAPLAKLWIFLQFAYLVYSIQRDFSLWMLGCMALVL